MKSVDKGGRPGAGEEDEDAEEQQDEQDWEEPPLFIVTQEIKKLSQERGRGVAFCRVFQAVGGLRIVRHDRRSNSELLEVAADVFCGRLHAPVAILIGAEAAVERLAAEQPKEQAQWREDAIKNDD